MKVDIRVKAVFSVELTDVEVADSTAIPQWLQDNLSPVVTDKDGVNYRPVDAHVEFYVTAFTTKDTNSESKLPRDHQILPAGG